MDPRRQTAKFSLQEHSVYHSCRLKRNDRLCLLLKGSGSDENQQTTLEKRIRGTAADDSGRACLAIPAARAAAAEAGDPRYLGPALLCRKAADLCLLRPLFLEVASRGAAVSSDDERTAKLQRRALRYGDRQAARNALFQPHHPAERRVEHGDRADIFWTWGRFQCPQDPWNYIAECLLHFAGWGLDALPQLGRRSEQSVPDPDSLAEWLAAYRLAGVVGDPL